MKETQMESKKNNIKKGKKKIILIIIVILVFLTTLFFKDQIHFYIEEKTQSFGMPDGWFDDSELAG